MRSRAGRVLAPVAATLRDWFHADTASASTNLCHDDTPEMRQITSEHGLADGQQRGQHPCRTDSGSNAEDAQPGGSTTPLLRRCTRTAQLTPPSQAGEPYVRAHSGYTQTDPPLQIAKQHSPKNRENTRNSLLQADTNAANVYPAPTTRTLSKKPLPLTTSMPAPTSLMDALSRPGSSQDAPAAMSKAHSQQGIVPDTQPMDSQIYRSYSESMMQRRESTPELQPMTTDTDTSPHTCHTEVTDDGKTQHTLHEGDAGYVDLAGVWRESSPVTSTQDHYDELLEESPQTQLKARDNIKTPFAGQKHARDGTLLTSAGTAKTARTPAYSQLFAGPAPAILTNTQLFDQTQNRSSPLPDGLRSDPVVSRPSPNCMDVHNESPLLNFDSSPTMTRGLRPSSFDAGVQRDTGTRAQKERIRGQLHAQWSKSVGHDCSDQDQDDCDETQDSVMRRHEHRRLRRALSDQAMVESAQIKAPARPGSRPSSSRKPPPSINLVTPATTRRGNAPFQDLLEEDVDADVANEAEEAELPEDEENTMHTEDEGEDSQPPNDDDYYDELGQTMVKSQANDPEESDEDGTDQDDAVMGDTELDDRGEEHPIRQLGEGSMMKPPTQPTPWSTIADSQPTTHENQARPWTTPHAQRSSTTSFVPGSQYEGQTSEDQAILASSQRKYQGQLVASGVATENLADVERLPSSPPLRRTSTSVPANSVEASLARRQILDQSKQRKSSVDEDFKRRQEIPESDLVEGVPEAQRYEAHDRPHSQDDEETQDTLNGPPYSTARTHVSASAPSPARLPHSQRSRITDPSPRKAAGVRRFGDMVNTRSQSDGSFQLDQDIDAIMNGTIMTRDDHEYVAAMSDPADVEEPQPKRRKTTRGKSSRTSAEVKLQQVQPQQTSNEGAANGTIADSEVDHLLPTQVSPQVLKDSPSKGNEMASVEMIEEPIDRESTSESVKIRERAGSAVVSQLIAARQKQPASKKETLPITYGKRGKKPVRKPKSVSVERATESKKTVSTERTVKHSRPKPPGHSEAQSVENQVADCVEGTIRAVDANDNSGPIGENATFGQVKDAANCPDSANNADTIVAPKRIFALFRGVGCNSFYPATWLATATDGMSHKVRFDDTTVTNIDTQHVRRLELRLGDAVRVDESGMRNKTWRIVGFTASAQTDQERELGTDIYGHARVKVQANKPSRQSTSNDALAAGSRDEGEVHEVLVTRLYITPTMWPAYGARTFVPPSTTKAKLVRAETPSTRSGTPTTDTPGSRSRRVVVPTAKARALGGRTSHLREASVASSTHKSDAAPIFAGMAFAISYVADDTQKATVISMINSHGGFVLEDGFEELFDLPNVVSSSETSPQKSPPQKQRVPTSIVNETAGLQLKPDYKELNFVALIADRHSRRAKYMQALALGLPTLSGRWVVDSLDSARNASLANDDAIPLSWDRYLLPAGESSYLGGAIRSRTLAPYDASKSSLATIVASRSILLDGASVVIVAPKNGKGGWEKRRTYAFLTIALGAGSVKRVQDLSEAKELVRQDPEAPMWVYVDGSCADAETLLFGKAAPGKKRKRGGQVVVKDEAKMSACAGSVRIVNDEFVVQSLILGGLIE